MSPVLAIIILIIIGSWAVWTRYRAGGLLSPVTGLHLQIIVFYGFGGLGYLLFPEMDPILASSEIFELSLECVRPLLIGYGIAIVTEHYYFPLKKKIEQILTQHGTFPSPVVAVIAVFGFAGCLLEGELNISGLGAIPAYFKHLFFPALLITIINVRNFGIGGRLISALILMMAVVVGIWSPWRSVLIMLVVSVMLGVVLLKPRMFPVAAICGLMVMAYLLPFQHLKKKDFERFLAEPTKMVRESLVIELNERMEFIGEFVVTRINYLRELSYVKRSVDGGMELELGRTYSGIVFQLVPRILWPSKPEMAHKAGYEIPREIGLLQKEDPSTSWAVNMFAEASYNFGIWCLVWFVPLVFAAAVAVERILSRFFRTNQALVLGNLVFFYLLFGVTTVIFLSSQIIAVMIVVKICDLIMDFIGMSEVFTGSRDRKF